MKKEKSIDLVVERYKFSADKANSRSEAIIKASSLADSILYNDIYGALELDLVKGWGKEGPNYPQCKEHNDGIARWKSRWHIPPHEYERGIRWKPLDGMQQFYVSLEVKKGERNYQGFVKIIAYVWDDKKYSGDGRVGCLLDIVDRNRDAVIFAETGRIAIPMDKNSKKGINDADLYLHGTRWHVGGFTFPPDSIGDVGHVPIKFVPIDINKRHEDCKYRDR